MARYEIYATDREDLTDEELRTLQNFKGNTNDLKEALSIFKAQKFVNIALWDNKENSFLQLNELGDFGAQ